MKHFLLIIFIAFSLHNISFSQKVELEYDAMRNLPDWFNPTFHLKEYDHEYKIDNSINPFYLEADFDNGGQIDIAIFVKNKQSNEKGILIKHQEDSKIFILGAGKSFNEMTNFDWVDIWKLYRQPYAEVTTFTEDYDIEGSKTVVLKNIAIEVSREESPGNLIVWNGKEYIWLHTGD